MLMSVLNTLFVNSEEATKAPPLKTTTLWEGKDHFRNYLCRESDHLVDESQLHSSP